MKAAIFDMDGTLISSMEKWCEACVSPLIKRNISYPEDIVNIITPLGMKKTAEYYLTLGIDDSAEEILSEILGVIEYEYKHNIQAKPYVYEYLEKLKAEGVKMCVLTASARKYAIPCLERLDLLKYFEFFTSSDETGYSKTNPEIFRLTAEKLGFSVEETAVFDDNLEAISAAKQAGTIVYGVYDKSSEHLAEEIKKNCDSYIKSFEELI